LEIGAKTISQMVSQYNCEPSNILAGIGPSIGSCCFETHADVADNFYKAGYDTFIVGVGNGKFMIDLWGINKQILSTIIPPQNIETSSICTKCNHNDFFSHREMGDDRGSMASFICLS